MTAFALVIGFTSANPVELSAASTCNASGWTKNDSYRNEFADYIIEPTHGLQSKVTCSDGVKKVYVTENGQSGINSKQYMRIEYDVKTGNRKSATFYNGTASSKNARVGVKYYHSNGKLKQINRYNHGGWHNPSKQASDVYRYNTSGKKTSYTKYNERGQRTAHYTYTGKSGEYTRYDYTDGKKKTRTAYYKSGSTSRKKVSYYNSKEKVYKANFYSKKGSSWKCTSTTKY